MEFCLCTSSTVSAVSLETEQTAGREFHGIFAGSAFAKIQRSLFRWENNVLKTNIQPCYTTHTHCLVSCKMLAIRYKWRKLTFSFNVNLHVPRNDYQSVQNSTEAVEAPWRINAEPRHLSAQRNGLSVLKPARELSSTDLRIYHTGLCIFLLKNSEIYTDISHKCTKNCSEWRAFRRNAEI